MTHRAIRKSRMSEWWKRADWAEGEQQEGGMRWDGGDGMAYRAIKQNNKEQQRWKKYVRID